MDRSVKNTTSNTLQIIPIDIENLQVAAEEWRERADAELTRMEELGVELVEI